MEVPTTQYGRAEISHDPPYSAANFCCPSVLSAIMSIICPFSWLGACRVLHEKEGAMVYFNLLFLSLSLSLSLLLHLFFFQETSILI